MTCCPGPGCGSRIRWRSAIPFIGPWLAYLIFGGLFPTTELIGRFYVFHIMLIPGLMIGLIGAHLGILYLQKHTQFRGGRATEHNVVGRHFWPGQAFRSLGLMFLTAAILALVGGLVQINPVWIYGPFVPYAVSSPAQPDWYLGWLEGALRLGPNWEPTILGVTIPTVFLPGIVVPAILFGGFTLWPFIEAKLTGDHREHQLLQWPWEAPVRLAVGAAALTVFLVLTIAGGNDVLAVFLQVGRRGSDDGAAHPAVGRTDRRRVPGLPAGGRAPGAGSSDRAATRATRRSSSEASGRRVASAGRAAAAGAGCWPWASWSPGASPRPRPTQARAVSDLWAVFMVAAAAVAVLVWGLITYRDHSLPARFARPRLDPAQTHSVRLEIAWTVGPIILVVMLFWLSLGALGRINAREHGDVTVEISAYRWQWRFDYPGTGVCVNGTPDVRGRDGRAGRRADPHRPDLGRRRSTRSTCRPSCSSVMRSRVTQRIRPHDRGTRGVRRPVRRVLWRFPRPDDDDRPGGHPAGVRGLARGAAAAGGTADPAATP